MKEKKFPKEDEIVLCTVSRIFPTTIFCVLEGGSEGVIPISEIAPGRIRNVRDYVKEGKKVVCKVLRVEAEKGHITLSLRRVTSREKKEKLENYKKDKNSEVILANFYKKTKIKPDVNVIAAIKSKYESLFNYFQSVLGDRKNLAELNIKDEKDEDILYTLIKERVKPKKVKVTLDLEVKSHLPNGIERIKEILNVKVAIVKYISAPLYRLEIESENAKEAEKLLRKEAERLIKSFKGFGEVKVRNV